MEPIRVSVFGEGHDHKVTVTRNAAGEFVASASPIDERIVSAEPSTTMSSRRPRAFTPACNTRPSGRAFPRT